MAKETKKLLIKVGMVFIVSLLLFPLYIKESSYAFHGNTKDGNKIIESGGELKKGENVTLKIYFSTKAYAKSKSIKHGQHYHYIAWLEDGSLISISVSDYNKRKELDDLADAVYDYALGKTKTAPDPVTVTGSVVKLDSRVAEYYKKEVEYGKNTIDPTTMTTYKDESKFSKVYYLEIDTSFTRTWAIIISIVGPIVTLISGIVLVILIFKHKELEPPALKPAMTTQGKVTTPKDDNDPIFNKSFYSTYTNKDTYYGSSDYKEDFSDSEDDKSDNNDVFEENNESPESSSKFKLKTGSAENDTN